MKTTTTTIPPTTSAATAAAEIGAPEPRYVAPGWFTRHVFNRLVRGLTQLGVSVWGSRILQVRGRRSGTVRETPVNLLEIDGTHYLVAPRGETQWVRNLRAAEGAGALRLGRTVAPFTAEEVLDPDAKADVLRPYLRRWKAEVGAFFGGVGPDAPHADLAAIAPRHPVFRLTLQAGT